MSEMNASGQSEESYAELSPTQNIVDELLKSTYLWTSLRRLHEDMNAKSRFGSRTPLSPESLHMANLVLGEVRDFLGNFADDINLTPFDEAAPPTCIDALIRVGQHKAALRSYMIEMLGKNPYTLS
ncbi:MAG: hypothetical protein U0105_17955 [Candidatus Obscuribacterales bacterium]